MREDDPLAEAREELENAVYDRLRALLAENKRLRETLRQARELFADCGACGEENPCEHINPECEGWRLCEVALEEKGQDAIPKG